MLPNPRPQAVQLLRHAKFHLRVVIEIHEDARASRIPWHGFDAFELRPDAVERHGCHRCDARMIIPLRDHEFVLPVAIGVGA